MKIEFVPKNGSIPNQFVIELSRTEAMELIVKLASALLPHSVNRYEVVSGTQSKMKLTLTDMINGYIGDVLYCVNIKEGYLSGDSIK